MIPRLGDFASECPMSRSKSYLSQFSGKVRELGPLMDFYTALEAFGAEASILAWGGRQSRFAGIALEWEERDPAELWQMNLEACWSQATQATGEPVFLGGWLGLRSYECSPALARDRVFRVTSFLLFDQSDGLVYELREAAATRQAQRIDWQVLLNRTDSRKSVSSASFHWLPQSSDSAYLDLAARCLQDIRQGRYYQINILRYFTLKSRCQYFDWVERLRQYGGPFSCMLRLPDLELYSFSPERFFRIEPSACGLKLVTEPIKGTAPVVADSAHNNHLRANLAQSQKDRAELQMIVDLMRNDLNRICLAQSVKVEDPGTVHSFSNVHHLIARVSGQLAAGLSLGDLFSALCPGGSITGAPKREVMQAIREYEGRERNYFMGNFFLWTPQTGYFDSSILIRTAQRLGPGPTEFAAGSGLVIRSQPEDELAEIKAKCRVVMDRSPLKP